MKLGLPEDDLTPAPSPLRDEGRKAADEDGVLMATTEQTCDDGK